MVCMLFNHNAFNMRIINYIWSMVKSSETNKNESIQGGGTTTFDKS